MKLEDCIYKSLLEYPSLFLCNNCEDSKMLVLNQLFLVNGNGMDWAISKDGKQEGYLIEDKHRRTKDDEWIRLPDKPYGKPIIKNKLSFEEIIEKYTNEYIEGSRYNSIRKLNEELPKELQEVLKNKRLENAKNNDHLNWIGEDSPFTPYPYASEYWPFAKIDHKLIQPDWKQGMIQCFKWALQYYETTEEDKYGINHAERLVRIRELGNAIHILESFK